MQIHGQEYGYIYLAVEANKTEEEAWTVFRAYQAPDWSIEMGH